MVQFLDATVFFSEITEQILNTSCIFILTYNSNKFLISVNDKYVP